MNIFPYNFYSCFVVYDVMQTKNGPRRGMGMNTKRKGNGTNLDNIS